MTLEFKTHPDYTLYLCLLWMVLVASCKNESSGYITLEGQAQGTTFQITYKDPFQQDYSGEVDSLFKLIDKSMSLWDTSSLITRINKNDSTAIPDEHFIKVFGMAQEISESTDGAFDVTIGPLVKAWGFSRKNMGPPPDSSDIDSLLKITGYRKVQLVDGRIKKEDPRITLDFNAIAQGYTVDIIAAFLRSRGIDNYLVEIGGEIMTNGKNQRNMAWQVGIDSPVDTLAEGRPLQTTIALQDKALATSGSYRKYIMKDGKKLSHVIDPATGDPLHQKVLSVSVLAEDCATADAYATAFLVLGIEKAMVIAKEKGLEVYCIYADDSGIFQTVATQGFSK
jgi:FAD:protein FMN transferase